MSGVIKFQRGWEHALLQRSGVMSAALYTALTQNQFKPRIDLEPRDLVCLPESKRPHRWFRKVSHRLSFVSQEKWAWLQIAFAIYIRYLNLFGKVLPADMDHMVARFPGIGMVTGKVAVYFCDAYPKQSHDAFKDHLEWHLSHLRKDGLIGKWVIPFSTVMPRKPFLFRRDTVSTLNLERLLDGACEVVALDVQDLYQNVLVAERS